MAVKTKRQLETENKNIRGKRPPDNDELVKNLEKGGLTADMAGLNIPNTDEPLKKESPRNEKTEPTEEELIEQEQAEQERLEREQAHEKSKVITVQQALEVLGITGPPTLQQSFEAVMMAYGYSQGGARQISRHAAVTGDANIFSDPEKLLDVLNEFRNMGDPSTRKLILDFYIDFCKLKPSQGYIDKVGLYPGKAKEAEEKKRDADKIYFYDYLTGDIRPPMQGETPMTLEQAQQYKRMTQHEHPGSTDGVQRYIKNIETGVWIINPELKNVTAADYAYVESMNPKPDAIDLISMGEQKKKQLQEAMGVKPEGNGDGKGKIFGMTMEEFTAFKSVFAPQGIDPGLKAILDSQQKILEELVKSKDKVDDPRIVELERKYELEREARHQAELARRDAENVRQAEETAKLQKRVEELAARPPAGSESELGVIKELGGKVMDKVDNGLNQVIGLVKANPPPLGRGEKQNLKDALKATATETPKAAPDVPDDVKNIVGKYTMR